MRRIALINGSPKMKNSASACILEVLKKYLDNDNIAEYNLRLPQTQDIEEICEREILVFAFPLYVDGVPSNLLNCLYQLEQHLKNKHAETVVYAIANCGFYEGKQSSIALDMMENWCIKSNVRWGQGIGIGGGGMMPMLNGKSAEKGPMKNTAAALKELANHIQEEKSAENLYVSPNFPRILYKMAAEMGWRQQIRANGLKRKDLFLRKSR
ncbi:MAG: hypothetical protein ABRQ27_07405 [Clostridiaceae bacterium]